MALREIDAQHILVVEGKEVGKRISVTREF